MFTALLACTVASAGAAQPAPITFDATGTGGLSVTVGGVPVIRGSMFQYYAPGWTRGYYSSYVNANPPEITRPNPDTLRLTWKTNDGSASGQQTITRSGNTLTIRYQFEWNDANRPARVEFGHFLWQPLVDQQTIINGQRVTMPNPSTYKSNSDDKERTIGGPAQGFSFGPAPLRIDGTIEGRPLTMFDARGYNQEFARNRPIVWAGYTDMDVAPGKPVTGTITLRFATPGLMEVKRETKELPGRRIADAVSPGETRLPMVPKPAMAELNFEQPVPVGLGPEPRIGTPEARARAAWSSGVNRRFALSGPVRGVQPRFVLSESLPADQHQIDIDARRIEVRAGSYDALAQGARRLSMLAFVKDGRIVLPSGSLADQPKMAWRGVHLFVGPTALEFHKKLWERVLLPMGFNKVVLQCEQTAWESVPNLRGGITMPREDLRKLFDWYRSVGVEPIPLVQSFGHMSWLFRNGQNLDVAYSTNPLHSIDPRKPRTREILNRLWDEVAEVTKAKTFHFGLDEVDMRGFAPGTEDLVTELWRMHVPFLNSIAERHGATPMYWSDMALAPNEAVDATNGHTPAVAKSRREVIAPGAFIGDWHYRDDPRPETFLKSLQIWKREGFRPIASGWFRPGNIRGFALAAIQEGAGYLQTTWAGFESRESEMIRELRQFEAMVMAGDYTWSGRTEATNALGYDPAVLFRTLYFGERAPLRNTAGIAWGTGNDHGRVGRLGFHASEVARLRSIVTPSLVDAPAEVELRPRNATASKLGLVLHTAVRTDDGDTVAEVIVKTDRGEQRLPLVYGRHVRSMEDPAPVLFGERNSGLTAIQVPLPAGTTRIESVRIRTITPHTGLVVRGMTTW